MIKTYIVKNGCNLITTISVGGVERTVEFKGGTLSPSYTNGCFSTSDECLQNAIESDFGFGRSFELLKQNGNCCIEVLDVCDKQTAIEWVEEEFGVVMPVGISKSKIIDFALNKGVTFPKFK